MGPTRQLKPTQTMYLIFIILCIGCNTTQFPFSLEKGPVVDNPEYAPAETSSDLPDSDTDAAMDADTDADTDIDTDADEDRDTRRAAVTSA